MLHLEEKDYQIAYSYFYEAFELYQQNKNKEKSAQLFSYMILTKIMSGFISEAEILLQGKYGEIYNEVSKENQMMVLLAKIYKEKSLVDLYNLF